MVVLKAGRTSAGAKAASSHTGALAGNDKIYEDVFAQSGVIRARSLRQLLEFARGVPVLPTPKGENILIITVRAVRACCCRTRWSITACR